MPRASSVIWMDLAGSREHFVPARLARQFDDPVMEVRYILWGFRGHRDDVELRDDSLRVGPLVTWNARLRHHRVQDALPMAFPGVRRSAHQHAAGTEKQPRLPERQQRVER